MRTLIAALLFASLMACSRSSAPKATLQLPSPHASHSLEQLQRDVACLNVVEACLVEAQGAHLYDPLDSFTREQEELIAARACLTHLRECRK